MENDHDISVIIPAYNEQDTINEVVRESQSHVDEVLVIDDASSDETASRARANGATVIKQERNRGPLVAIKRGFDEAKGDIVVTVDADGEMPLGYIPDLVRPIIQNEADMVQGHRTNVPRFSEIILTWVAGLGGEVGDSGTGFRAIRTSLARELNLNGICICGIFSLEVLRKGGKILERDIKLRSTDKSGSHAWFHLLQLYYVLKELMKLFYFHTANRFD